MVPPGPTILDNFQIVLPSKDAVQGTIQGMIAHMTLVTEGIKVPAGEVYRAIEGSNGELGFFIVSDGSGRPYKCHCRAPCFYTAAALRQLLIGHTIADLAPTFATLNVVAGECDR